MSGGPQIPGYTFLQHLGSGGFADVFLYEQDWPRQQVAVKVVRPDIPLTDREKSLFTAEANAMAQLADHPYIVSVVTAGVTGDRPYLVMRYCPPPDLGVRVRTAPLSTAEAISTGIKIASAVETAHRAGIVHRDIKPSNVLITSYNEPALTDFGIAGHLHEVDRESEVRISYPWSPPELLDGRSNGSVASDVYSLGATIWNLLTGRSPFAIPHGDNSAHALTARILHTPPPPTGRQDVPPALERLLSQCLAKQPVHRPRTALELARALQRIETDAGYSRTPIAVTGDVSPMTPHGDDASDVTSVKPMTVIPASGPRAAGVDQGRSTGSRPLVVADDPPPRRSTMIWAVAGIVIAVVAAGAMVIRNQGATDKDDDPTPEESSRTPNDLNAPLQLDTPILKGTRQGDRVTFTWSAKDGAQKGDTWEWTRTESDERKRTADRSAVVRSPNRVCLQLVLIRPTGESAPAHKCVS